MGQSRMISIMCLFALNAHSLHIDGQEEFENEKQGLVSLYLFNETSGPYLDTSENGNPLNLEVSAAAESFITRKPGSILINQGIPARGIASAVPATKIIQQCKASSEITLEAYVRTTKLNQNGPARIVTLSSDTQNRNFTLGHTYDGEGHFILRLRTKKNGRNGSRSQPASSGGAMRLSGDVSDAPQHVVMTRSAGGTVRIYVDGVLSSEDTNPQLAGDMSNWDDDMQLGIGNELGLEEGMNRFWKGELYLFAVYCRAKTIQEVVGDVAFIEMPSIMPKANSEISEHQRAALKLYKRLTGVATSIDDPKISAMASHIRQGDIKSAAVLATEEPSFYNFVVRDFAAKMSTKEESVKTPLNDFTATVIGVVRDQLSAKTLLTGNFFYRGAPGKTAVVSDVKRDIIQSNNHYAQLEEQNYDLASSLVKESGQKLLTSDEDVVVNPDAAGLLTTRAFMQAHASAGTNRRLVEFAFRQFLCTPIEHWADATSSDAHIGRDVDRYPGGSNAKFQTTCKSCHSNMDGLRGAFARYDFSDGIIKNALFIQAAANPDEVGPLEMAQSPLGIAAKMNHNSEVFAEGHTTQNTSWVNNAVHGANAAKFGWRNSSGEPIEASKLGISGNGLRQLGEMISNSKAFSSCMTERVFVSTCGREPDTSDKDVLSGLSQKFEAENYNIKSLFENIASAPECLGIRIGGQ